MKYGPLANTPNIAGQSNINRVGIFSACEMCVCGIAELMRGSFKQPRTGDGWDYRSLIKIKMSQLKTPRLPQKKEARDANKDRA